MNKAAGTGTAVITQLCTTAGNGNESLTLRKSRILRSHNLKKKERKKKKTQIHGKKKLVLFFQESS